MVEKLLFKIHLNTLIAIHKVFLHYKIKLFPKVVLKNKSYYPVLKEVENFFIESPSYASEQSVLQIINLLKKIQSDPEWTDSQGK